MHLMSVCCCLTYVSNVAHLRPGKDVLARRVHGVAFPLLTNKTHQLWQRKGVNSGTTGADTLLPVVWPVDALVWSKAFQTLHTGPSSSSPRSPGAAGRKRVSPAPLACCGRSGRAAPETRGTKADWTARTPPLRASAFSARVQRVEKKTQAVRVVVVKPPLGAAHTVA